MPRSAEGNEWLVTWPMANLAVCNQLPAYCRPHHAARLRVSAISVDQLQPPFAAFNTIIIVPWWVAHQCSSFRLRVSALTVDRLQPPFAACNAFVIVPRVQCYQFHKQPAQSCACCLAG